jgi:single-strand DNA-binding protein
VPRPAVAGPSEEDTVVDHHDTHLNLAVIRGRLSSDPVDRTLPSGDLLVAYEVSITRPDAATESVPVVLIGGRPPAGLVAGDEVVVVGRVRRRFFRAGGGTASRTEIVADQLVPARRRTAVLRAIGAATDTLATPRTDT